MSNDQQHERTPQDVEKEKLWAAFRKGFFESGEGWNGEMLAGNESAWRRVYARFEALYDAGKFDDPEPIYPDDDD